MIQMLELSGIRPQICTHNKNALYTVKKGGLNIRPSLLVFCRLLYSTRLALQWPYLSLSPNLSVCSWLSLCLSSVAYSFCSSKTPSTNNNNNKTITTKTKLIKTRLVQTLTLFSVLSSSIARARARALLERRAAQELQDGFLRNWVTTRAACSETAEEYKWPAKHHCVWRYIEIDPRTMEIFTECKKIVQNENVVISGQLSRLKVGVN